MVKHLLSLVIGIVLWTYSSPDISVASEVRHGILARGEHAHPVPPHQLRIKKAARHTGAMSRIKALGGLIPIIGGPVVLCPGSSQILAAAHTPSGATYQWFKDDIPIPNEVASTYAATVVGTYFVRVTTDGVAVDDPAVTLIAGTSPTASFNHTPDGSCSSSPIGFTSTSTGTGLTYLWDFGDPNSGRNNTSSTPNPKHKFIGSPGPADQNYTVKLTVTNIDGCSASATATITMKQRPGTELAGPSFNPSYQGQSYFTGCGTGPVLMTFENRSSTDGTNTDYLIKWGDRSTDYHANSFTNVDHTYAAGIYRLAFIVTGKNCKDTAFYNIFVGSNPTVGLAGPGNTTICTGSSLTFKVTNTQNNPPSTIYTVSYGDNTPRKTYTSPPDTIMHYFNRSSCGGRLGNYDNSFLVKIEARNPCSSSSAEVAPIYVSQKPDAQFTISNDIDCVNNVVTFTNSKPGTEVNNGICKTSVFVWSITPKTGWTANNNALGDDLSGSRNSNLWKTGSLDLPVTFTAPGTYTIKLKVGSTSCGADSITKTVCINPAPVASFSTDVAAGCGPLIVKTTNTSPLPNCGNNTYRWTVLPNSGFTFTNGTNETSANPEISFNDAGNYTLSLTTSDPNGMCTSSQVSKQILVNVKPAVSPIVTAASLCEGSTTTPTATVNSSGNATYLWTFEGGIPATSDLLVPGTITYPVPGNYTTTFAVTNNCGTTTVTKPISVSARPTVAQPQNYPFFAGDPSGLISFTGTPGATFNWTNNNTDIGLDGAGSGDISFTTKNTTNAPIIATITVTPANGCTGKPVSFTITVHPAPPVGVTTNGILSTLRTVYGTPSTATSFRVTATGLPAGVTVIPPTGFEASTDGASYTSSVPISGNGGATLYFRLSATTDAGKYPGVIEFRSGSYQLDVNMPIGMVDPAPLTLTATTIGKTYGELLSNGPATESNYTIEGTLKNGDELATVNLVFSNGNGAADNVGIYPQSVNVAVVSGNSSFKITNYKITPVPGDLTVGPARLVIKAIDASRDQGTPDPVFTVEYNGFVNNENPAVLLRIPVVTTTATAVSSPGIYKLLVGNASATNYTISYIEGTLTINAATTVMLNIPNTFTPNGDGINDTWDIANISRYPNCHVTVFDRYGRSVYNSNGYANAWSGKYKGTAVPNGTYYFLIDLKNNSRPLSGSLTVIR